MFPRLRQSQLGEFDLCGLKSWFTIAHRRGWGGYPQARGTIFHRVAAECLREMARQGETMIPVDAALEILRECLLMVDPDSHCGQCGSENVDAGVRRDGTIHCYDCGAFTETQRMNLPIAEARDLHWVVAKWAFDNEFPIHELVDVEQRLHLTVHYADPRPNRASAPRTLSGQLDTLFVDEEGSHAIVLDWKDTWALPPLPEISFEGYFQQRFYAGLIFANFPSIARVTLREFYVRRSQAREASITRLDEPEILAELTALARRFDEALDRQLGMSKRRAFVPTPGMHCSMCARPTACPIPVFARREGRITTLKRAEEVAKQLQVAEKIVKDARRDLRAFAATHGPIPIKTEKGMRALGYTEVTKRTKPDMSLIWRAEREKGAPLTAEEIGALHQTGTTTRFGICEPEVYDLNELDAMLRSQVEESVAEYAASHPTEED
jgi:PD-(D/E)XK nuclease superfamily